MKKKLTYRDQLLELSRIYNVREIQEYIKSKKNLTTGQLELILRKNKIIIPKDFKTSFFKENISKPLSKVSRKIDDIKDDTSKTVTRYSRKITYFKEDSSRTITGFFYNLWKRVGNAGLGFLNVIPKLGQTYYSFFSNFFTNLFHGIYNQQVNKGKVGKVILSFFVVAGVITIVVSGVTTFKNIEKSGDTLIVKKEIEKTEKKPEVKNLKLKRRKRK